MRQLSMQEMITSAPAINAEAKQETLTKRFKFVSTKDVIEDVTKLGWTPVSAKQRKNKDVNPLYAQHMVEFRIDHPIAISHKDDLIYPQISLVNAHNGKSSFRFYAGLFRLVCSNGLVVPVQVGGESLGDGFRIRHDSYDIKEVKSTIEKLVKGIQKSMKPIYALNERTLTDKEKRNLAKRGLSIRNEIKSSDLREFLNSIPDETVDSILTPKRGMDTGNNAWRVFNTVQESLVGGDFQNFLFDKESNLKFRSARPLSDMFKTQKFNINLLKEAQLLLN